MWRLIISLAAGFSIAELLLLWLLFFSFWFVDYQQRFFLVSIPIVALILLNIVWLVLNKRIISQTGHAIFAIAVVTSGALATYSLHWFYSQF
ncbi:hypothetical protein A2949_00130 [Candidatus Adlerbacteria bacterium RIFCSPLOWO2_01_FULL_54_21b]|uniref:Uncharacterized protein n=1 Tax=Candidatus Adlerbacteria bacterium RIFCSPLOWO2_01_FULL_54_21b TaxID=1797245 RepID=A0A1F4XX93_9BACT|nr:MAG: hypothetical protein A2949_00130 [Candidatus Adlerbacteria bacterium RIFCSPLOWO2_01_FULL_54_21b]